MILRKCNGRRIKSCADCDFLGCEVWGGGIACNKFDYILVDLSFRIPMECRLPIWERTLPIKEDSVH